VLGFAFEDIAVDRGWIALQREFDEQTSLPAVVARSARRILDDLEPGRKIAEKIKRSFAGLGTFSVKDPNGFELSYTPSSSTTTDALGEDFTDLLLALGQAAAEKHRGVAFLLDEVQFVGAEEFGPFVVGLHRLNQKALPVTCVAAGLPSLPALVGEAKSYAERLFEYPRIDRLSRLDAISALRDPARSRKVVFEDDALEHIFGETEGYPYFLQQYGKYAWDVASPKRITIEDARLGGREAQERLDEGFFQVRYERASAAERGFLGAMSRCEGPPYPIADVTRELDVHIPVDRFGARPRPPGQHHQHWAPSRRPAHHTRAGNREADRRSSQHRRDRGCVGAQQEDGRAPQAPWLTGPCK
jgi:hypothetical protein